MSSAARKTTGKVQAGRRRVPVQQALPAPEKYKSANPVASPRQAESTGAQAAAGPEKVQNGCRRAPVQQGESTVAKAQNVQIGAAPIVREHFQTSRQADFLQEKELTPQIGHPRPEWPSVIPKEFLDNSEDACEEAGISPVLTVIADEGGIEVRDNGPGLPSSTLDAAHDFTTKISSREAQVGPTRGAQGNASQTAIAMAGILDKDAGRFVVHSDGKASTSRVYPDPVTQHAVVEREVHDRPTLGTAVRIAWAPRSDAEGQPLWPFVPGAPAAESYDQVRRIVESAAAFNPHATFSLEWFGETETWNSNPTPVAKWLPSAPASAHWFTKVERLERLIGACIAHDQYYGRDRLVSDFVRQFHGLARSQRLAKVLDAAGLKRAHLSELVVNGRFDTARIARLLAAMKEATRVITPRMLGCVGEEHLRRVVESLGAIPDSIRTRRVTSVAGAAVPWVFEIAFGYSERNEDRIFRAGVNWSPSLGNPFRQLGSTTESLDGVLSDQWAGRWEPAIVVVHLAHPCPAYTDRGKSAIAIDDDLATAIIGATKAVTKVWAKQRRAEDRGSRSRVRRGELRRHESLKEICYRLMREAYLQASDNGRLPTPPRMIGYVMRNKVLAETGQKTFDIAKYFSQTLLPNYMAEHPEETADWDVVFDARGTLREPHTRRAVAVGTLPVRRYRQEWLKTQGPVHFEAPSHFQTAGPQNRAGAAIAIEKDGFTPMIDAAGVLERHDVIQISSKGQSTVAARQLVDDLGVPIFTIHDFDISGFSIAAAYRRDNRRYTFQNDVKVVDFGLRLEDVREWNLADEPVDVPNRAAAANRLAADGATEEEIEFLVSGRRVELNAFTATQFIAWLESKLEAHGVKKVVPGRDVLQQAYRRALQVQLARDRVDQLVDEAGATAAKKRIPADLAKRVNSILAADRSKSWDAAVAEIVAEGNA